jgi:uncharacterized membrane protein YuzA (DUF378 family)
MIEKLHFLARFFLVVGGLNYLYINYMNKSFFGTSIASKAITTIIGLSALLYLFDRDFYLPFLGKTFFPFGKRAEVRIDESSRKLVSITVDNLPPNTTVIYWASQNEQKVYSNPKDAYGDFGNRGITMTDKTGKAILQIQCPSVYNVGKLFKKTLDKHLHYRYELPEYPGMFSDIKTKYVNNECN